MTQNRVLTQTLKPGPPQPAKIHCAMQRIYRLAVERILHGFPSSLAGGLCGCAVGCIRVRCERAQAKARATTHAPKQIGDGSRRRRHNEEARTSKLSVVLLGWRHTWRARRGERCAVGQNNLLEVSDRRAVLRGKNVCRNLVARLQCLPRPPLL